MPSDQDEELEQILQENSELEEKDLLLPREGVKTALPMILFILSGSRADGNQYITLQEWSMMDRVKITRNSEHYVYVIVLKFLL